MKRTGIIVAVGALALASLAFATRSELAKAPDFTLPASSGKTVSLADYKGKWVVLEWWNNGCPYVKRHYEGNMQAIQKEFTKDGAVWLSIVSSAPGQQGYVTADEANKIMKELGGAPTAILLNPEGDVGKKYDAKTTPHMYLISPKGEIVYDGAIDSSPRGPANGEGVVNYLKQAYAEAKAGKAVSNPKTRPYGCSVKYKS